MSATFIVTSSDSIPIYWKTFMVKYPEYEYLFRKANEDINSKLAKYNYLVITNSWAIPAYDFMAMLPEAIKKKEVIFPTNIWLNEVGKRALCKAGPKGTMDYKFGQIKGSVYIV